jgi:hypothetical protein
MPMQPNYLPLVKIFGSEVRHTVPLFQRPYVWSREDQWEPLWQDISNLADRVMAARAEQVIAGHFLGTVVLEQAQSATGSIPRREVIDGQQRLTTLQVLLRAAEHALGALSSEARSMGDEAGEHRSDVASRQVGALTLNPAFDTREEKYKVWPTNHDRAAFQEVMDAPGPSALIGCESQLAKAYLFFHDMIVAWLHHDEARAARATAFGVALKEHLRLIVLDLDHTDEPQAIFETLNANGAPLLPADLMKNWLLWEATRQKTHDLQRLYEAYWQFLDHDPDYWRGKSGSGHAARARVDTFLQNWLIRRTHEPVPSRHLYDRFLRYASPRHRSPNNPAPADDLVALMSDIHTDGHRFREINHTTGQSRFHRFLARLAKLDFAAFHPLLLELMCRPGSSNADRDAAAIVLESYLVRRTICWEETRAYATLAIDLLKALATAGPQAAAAPVLAATLGGLTAGPNRWPDDERFRAQWCRQKFYGSIRRSRVMMILQALEEHYQTGGTKGEPIVAFDFSKLEIEHIMPQQWEANYPLPSVENARVNREQAIHGIGNLTLVSGKLNPSLSNSAWLDGEQGLRGKRAALDQHARLQLNCRLVRGYGRTWDEGTMSQRALELFEAARLIWPDAAALMAAS